MKPIAIVLFCFASLQLQVSSALTQNQTPRSANPTSLIATQVPRRLDHGGKIETKYDGFSRETVVTLKQMRITCGAAKGMQSTIKDTCISFVVSLHCPGEQLDNVRNARLRLIFETKDWDKRHPTEERDLVVVADGERLKLGTMGLVKQDLGTTQLIDVMKEVLEVSIPYQSFNKIARAQTVEMKVGNTMFELRDKNLAALSDLNNRVKL